VGLLQKDVAEQIGTHVQTVRNWEMGETSPALPWWPGIIGFLGYDPRPVPVDFAARLIHHRVGLGLSQVTFARLLGVDPGTLRSWESGRRRPQGEYVTRLNAALKTGSR
jgi:DNA-binding transcriptional regulator YiaG